MKLNSTAERAREQALARHRAELDCVRRAMRGIKVICYGLLLAVLVLLHLLYKGTAPWRQDKAPALQKVHGITPVYVDKKGVWRSYDTGEPVTVKQWRP